jgi:hypothetical protein
VRSPVRQPPSTAPTIAWLPHSASAATCSFGYADAFGPDPIRPNRSTFSAVSATSKLVASIAINRRRASQAPFVPEVARGTAARSNNAFIGAGPSRCRAWVIADLVGTCQSSSHEPSLRRLPTSRRITSSYESAKNNPIAITYRTITCAGSRRERFSRRDVRWRTSSSRSRLNRADTTPNPIWSVNRPHGRSAVSTTDVTASHRTASTNNVSSPR